MDYFLLAHFKQQWRAAEQMSKRLSLEHINKSKVIFTIKIDFFFIAVVKLTEVNSSTLFF